MLVPLYLYAWIERKNIQVERDLKVALVAFIGYLLFFTLTSSVPKLSVKGGYDILRGMLLFPFGICFAGLVAERKNWSLVNLVSLLFVLGPFIYPQSGRSFYSYSPNPNNAAVGFIIFICLLIPAMDSLRPRLFQICSFIGLPVAMFLLFMTNGRGAWSGLAIASIFLCLFVFKFRKRYRVLMGSIVGIGFTVLMIFYNVKGFRLSRREEIWDGLFQETLDNYFYNGYGLNGTKALMAELEIITHTAHNIFLEIFVSSGLLGLLFILLWSFFVWRIYSQYNYPNNHVVISALLAIVAFLVMGQVDLKFASSRFSGTIFLFLGMIYSQRVAKNGQHAVDSGCLQDETEKKTTDPISKNVEINNAG